MTSLPVLLFLVCATALTVGLIVFAWALGPARRGAVKEMPYESGMDPIHDTRRRFDVRFHLVAIAFLLFDVELLFLYPWAVAARPAVEAAPPGAAAASSQPPSAGIQWAVDSGLVECRHLVFGGVMAFILLLVLGFIYDWKKGIFQWR